MPSVTAGGFSIRVIPGDHGPAHVHVVGRSGSAIFLIDPDVVVRDVGSMNRADLRKAREAILNVHDELIALWEQYGQA